MPSTTAPRALARLAVVLAVGGAAQAAIAHELVPAEKRILPYAADLPTCGDPSVLEVVSTRFAEKEAKFWHSSLTIVEYARITPVAWRPWGLDQIPRRFCTATATISDGRRTSVDYSVREDLGFIGNGWDIQFCATGLDRNAAYSPACRMARP